jgi:flagellar protein FliT
MAESHAHADQTRLVNEVYELTLEIETAVQLSDWQRAARLSLERSPMVRAITAVQSPPALALIRSIQALDAARLETLRTARETLARAFQQAQSSVGAARQYQRVARFF